MTISIRVADVRFMLYPVTLLTVISDYPRSTNTCHCSTSTDHRLMENSGAFTINSADMTKQGPSFDHLATRGQ